MLSTPDRPGIGVSVLPRRWRLLPWIMAALVWLGLAAIALDPVWEARARAVLPWMIEPLFHDWHVVRMGWAAYLDGVDPLAEAHQPFNYPRAVLAGAYLGGLAVPAPVAGLLLAAVLLATVAWVLTPRSRGEALLAAALLGSPPVLLLVERGNLDAVAFVLVAGGAALVERDTGERGLRWLGVFALTAAALVKLYPAVVLVGGVLYWQRARRLMLAAGGLAFGGWAASHMGEIALILQKTTRGYDAAYGRMTAGSRYFAELVAPNLAEGAGGEILRTLMHVSLGVCSAVFLLAVAEGWWWRRRIAEALGSDRTAVFFWSGGLICAGTFWLGSNWAYRLVFLVLCVPALWRAGGQKKVRWHAAGILVAITLLMLTPLRLPLGWFFVREAVAWGVAAIVLGGAVGVVFGRGAVPEPSVRPRD